jgi:lipopolysaccharide transport system permease protein
VPPRFPGNRFLHNLVERRSLLFQLVRRDFEQRFVGSAAGWVWGLIHPLVLLLSWTFVFSVCMKAKLPAGEVTQNYPLFLFAGMLPWLLFSETVNRSASSLLDQANLITKTVFPAEIVPLSIFLSALVSHLMALVLVMTVVGIWENQFSIFVLLLPLYMLLVGLFAVGIGWIVASLHVYLRDTAQMVSVLLTVWFWITPIFISAEQFPERWRFVLTGNPLSFVVRAYRDLLLSNRLPDAADLLLVTVYATATFVLGGLFFRHMKRGFADVL